jgi:hypothetical protein
LYYQLFSFSLGVVFVIFVFLNFFRKLAAMHGQSTSRYSKLIQDPILAQHQAIQEHQKEENSDGS